MTSGFETYAFVTFVTDVEKEQVLSAFEWEVFYLKDDTDTYYRTYILREGEMLPVIAAWQREKGSIAAAAHTMKAINRFHPQYVVSAGIAAGIHFKHKEAQPEYGDVVLADSTWNLSKGKYTEVLKSELADGDIGYIPRPSMTSLTNDVRKMLMRIVSDKANPVRVHIGTYLTSGAVVANSHFLEKAILTNSHIAKALDMESYGIAYACETAGTNRPIPIIAKGISDFANEHKSDDYQKLAAENSVLFIQYLLSRLPSGLDTKKGNKKFKNNYGRFPKLFSLLFSSSLKKWQVQQQELMKMEKELSILDDLKGKLLSPPHFEDESLVLDAMQIGQGPSFYTYRPAGNHKLAIQMASPVGKEIPSSILMASARNCFDVFLNGEMGLEEAVRKTNSFLSASNFAHILCEVWTAFIDYDNSLLHYVNAGHPAPFLIKNDGSIEDIAGGLDNPKLGLDDSVFTASQMHYSCGDTIVIVSRGIIECRNAEGEIFGRKRFRRFLSENHNLSSGQMNGTLDGLLREFSGDSQQARDWTVMKIEFMKNNHTKVFQGHIVDIINRRIFDGQMEVENGIIKSITECPGMSGEMPYIMPGFIDAHVHIESSMMTPAEFARVASRHGTIGAVSDPHEIANILGIPGVDYMLNNAAKTNFNYLFGAPSCVPSCGSDIETSGATLGAEAVESLLKRPEIGYLSEMMNFPGVLSGDPEVMAKIEAARCCGKPVDGHAPGLLGEERKNYIAAGISTDHECTSYLEGKECVDNDMFVQIREGSAAKNYEALIPLLSYRPDRIMFCTDDSHPGDFVFGHINNIVCRAIGDGYDLWDVLRAASLNPQLHYGLNWGLLREGDPATFIMVDSLSSSMRVLSTYLRGEQPWSVSSDDKGSYPNVFEAEAIREDDIFAEPQDTIPVIVASDGELFTNCEYAKRNDSNYPWNEVQKIVVVNRYRKGVAPAVGFVRGFNITDGAMAESIAHDCHNIVAVGSSDSQIVRVVNEVITMRGGIAALCGENRMSRLELPVAGLMSPMEGPEIATRIRELFTTIEAAGCKMRSPMITLSFMCLPVIPQLKITDKGLFDITKWDFINS